MSDSLKAIARRAKEIASSAYPPPALLESAFTFHKISYDQEKGLGNVPYNQSISYFGFVVVMSPVQFFDLVPKKFDMTSAKDIQALIKSEHPIACPFLTTSLDDGLLRVVDHEGRSRMYAITALYGPHHPVMVQVFVRGKRARNLSIEILQDFRMRTIPQGKTIEVKGPHFGNRVAWQKEWVDLTQSGTAE